MLDRLALDSDDRRALATLVVFALLFIAGCALIGYGLGLGVRAFQLGAGA